jgi:hypothetical protein
MPVERNSKLRLSRGAVKAELKLLILPLAVDLQRHKNSSLGLSADAAPGSGTVAYPVDDHGVTTDCPRLGGRLI